MLDQIVPFRASLFYIPSPVVPGGGIFLFYWPAKKQVTGPRVKVKMSEKKPRKRNDAAKSTKALTQEIKKAMTRWMKRKNTLAEPKKGHQEVPAIGGASMMDAPRLDRKVAVAPAVRVKVIIKMTGEKGTLNQR